jgi:ABC-type arginine/histidine transport system permease subunit
MKPALRTVYPALTSQFIFLMLTSSVVSVISANDLAAAGNDLQSQTFASFEVYLVITAMYLDPLARLFGALQPGPAGGLPLPDEPIGGIDDPRLRPQ